MWSCKPFLNIYKYAQTYLNYLLSKNFITMPNIERVFNLWKLFFCNKKYALFMKINVTLLFKTTENKKRYESQHIITIKSMNEYRGQCSINQENIPCYTWQIQQNETFIAVLQITVIVRSLMLNLLKQLILLLFFAGMCVLLRFCLYFCVYCVCTFLELYPNYSLVRLFL